VAYISATGVKVRALLVEQVFWGQVCELVTHT
jgi:hypothetical protein